MSSSGKNIFFTLLAGLGVGVVLGVLLAPDKGSETRSKLKNLARDLEDFIKKGRDPKESGTNENPE
jgi:gas vesicle protein